MKRKLQLSRSLVDGRNFMFFEVTHLYLRHPSAKSRESTLIGMLIQEYPWPNQENNIRMCPDTLLSFPCLVCMLDIGLHSTWSLLHAADEEIIENLPWFLPYSRVIYFSFIEGIPWQWEGLENELSFLSFSLRTLVLINPVAAIEI